MHYAMSSMRRRIIAAVWIAGATVPLLLATVFLFGCCVLPFHQVMHKLMPVCDIATAFMRGDVADHDATPAAPAREKQEPAKRIATQLPPVFRLPAAAVPQRLTPTPAATTAYRSFITLGAIRCDRDVGLHVLVETFLI